MSESRGSSPAISRRTYLGCVLGACLACGGAKAPEAFRKTTLHIDPLTDLVAAAGLSWLLCAEPRVLTENAALLPAIGLLASPERLRRFSEIYGGLDLKGLHELVVASYGDNARLSLVRGAFDPASIERAFQAPAINVDPKHVELSSPDGADTISRLTGAFRDTNGVKAAELVVFGREAAVLNEGGGPRGKAAMLFGRKMLKRSKPALLATPLDRVSKLLGAAPLRFFAPGPFPDAVARSALGGLLQVTTGLGARVLVSEKNRRAVVSLSVVLLGEWGTEREAARERLSAAWNVLAASGTGRLLGLDHPLEAPKVLAPTESDEAPTLWLHVSYDAERLAKSAADLLDGDIARILTGP